MQWLLAIARDRDRDAFTQLFAHFAPRLKHYLMRNGASSQNAEELAQETMVAVWRKADYYNPARAAASTWIFTIARNLRIDAARRERGICDSFSAHDHAVQEHIEGAAQDAPDAQLAAKQHELRIRAALTQLSADQATVIRLAFFGDKAHAEVARELGIPLGTVKSRIRLALIRLRTLLENN